MKKTIILALALALVGGAAYANFCARDIVPAATLLVPYIVIDTDASGVPTPGGYSTLTVVTNVSSAKQIIHVSVYNAASQAVVDFDEVLSGYDVWSINWKDLITGDFENFDTGSPAGGFWTGAQGAAPSAWGPTQNTQPTYSGLVGPWDYDAANLPDSTGVAKGGSCGFPWGPLYQYAPGIVSALQDPLVAWPGQDTNCDGTAEIASWPGWLSHLSAQPLQFYALIDVVNACNGYFAGSAEYWDGSGTHDFGYTTTNNVLTGYDFYMAVNGNYSESVPTVNIEAFSGYAGTGFYSLDRAAADATNLQDDHEPLGQAFAFNYFNGGGVTTEVMVWKNYDDFGSKYVLACRPYIYYAFDENENSKASQSPSCPSGTFCLQPEPNVFPFQTQKVAVNSTNFDGLPTTGNGNGWMMLIFDPAIPVRHAGALDNTGLQAYVMAKYNFGTFTSSVEATTLANVYCFSAQTLPNLNTNAGGAMYDYGMLYE